MSHVGKLFTHTFPLLLERKIFLGGLLSSTKLPGGFRERRFPSDSLIAPDYRAEIQKERII